MTELNAGFIGLGNLGKAMANRLLNEGVNLTVWNRTPEKAEGLDAERADHPSGVTEDCSVIFLNLRDSEAVEEVMATGKGLIKTDLGGKVIVDTTTNDDQSVEEFHEVIRAHKGYYLEAPVAGSVNTVRNGNLTIFISGDESAYDHAEPYLEIIGSDLFFLEEPGLATKVKLINNMVLGSLMSTLSEATMLGEEVGLEREQILDLLSSAAGNSAVLDAKREKLASGDFSPHFSGDLMYKDLRLVQDLSERTETPIFTGSIAKELFGRMLQNGDGNLDFSAIYRVLSGATSGETDTE